MLLIDIMTLTDILKKSDILTEEDNGKGIVNDYERVIISRMMLRLLNQIPVKDSKKNIKDLNDEELLT